MNLPEDLYDATTEIHHQAQETPFGKRMSDGSLDRQEWADWLGAMATIHHALDPFLPPSLQRLPALMLDLYEMLPMVPKASSTAAEIVVKLLTQKSGSYAFIGGLSYVISGANFRGGAVIRKTLDPLGFPCHHLKFDRDAAALGDRWIKSLRDVPQLADAANEAFAHIVDLMTEIDQRYHPDPPGAEKDVEKPSLLQGRNDAYAQM